MKNCKNCANYDEDHKCVDWYENNLTDKFKQFPNFDCPEWKEIEPCRADIMSGDAYQNDKSNFVLFGCTIESLIKDIKKLPGSRESSLVVTKLEEAHMWAEKAFKQSEKG